MARRARGTGIGDADYDAAMIRRYSGYTEDELRSEIENRLAAIEAGFLSRRERLDHEARIDQMRRALAAR